MLKRIRKSSGRVTLVLIGLGALSGCGDDTRRDVYASREDCLADWGNRPEDCTPATDERHRKGGFFYGPLYTGRSGFGSGWSWGSGDSTSSSSRSSRSSSSSSSSSRGGFGSSSRSSAS